MVIIAYILAGFLIAYAISEFIRFLISIIVELLVNHFNENKTQKEKAAASTEKKEDD
jgi:hypothetical protein